MGPGGGVKPKRRMGAACRAIMPTRSEHLDYDVSAMKSDNQGGPAHGGQQTGERRESKRVESRRDVVFSDYAAKGPLRTGSVTDMSPGGFQIATHYPEPSGGEVQIELGPLPGDMGQIAMFRGRVAYVTVPEEGAALMGVQLIPKSPALWHGVPSTRSSVRSGPGPRWGRQPVSAKPGVDTIHRHIPSPRRRSRRKPSTRTRSRAAWLAAAPLLALVLILLFLTLEAVDGEGLRGPTVNLRSSSANPTEIPEFNPVSTSTGSVSARMIDSHVTEGLERAGLFEWTQTRGIDRLLFEAHAALGQGNLAAAETLFAQLEGRGDADPVQRFASALGYAEAAAARGRERLARAVLGKALQLGDAVPEPWLRAGRALERRLNTADATLYRAVPMGTVLGIAPLKRSDTSELPVRIEVDTSRYTLRILKGDQVLQSFPVGLGRNGTTPLGTFEIANKIVEPAWYNHGEVVPAGDARNPLGSRWMGFGIGTRATSYGIHPTKEAESIGRALSAGCVRMRPEDAETVYRLAPIGTVVRIFR